jgi:iron complex outermembrane receptor protein
MMSSVERSFRQVFRPCAAAALLAAFVGAPVIAAETEGLEEVIVTAQFREQKLQDTPIAITAVSADMLEARNQTNLAQVAKQAPNVVLTETGGAFGPGMSAYIRGVGQADYIGALEPGVGIYVDDVYYPSLTGANFDLLDLERVEILRGPQGTLAGRNSEGGAVKLYSQQPKGDGTGSIRATYGSRNLLDIRAMGDFALIKDTLFVRISGVSKKQDGYVTRVDYGCAHPESGVPNRALRGNGDCFMGREGGKDYTAARLALRWLAADNLIFNLSGDMLVDNSEVAANVLNAAATISPFANIDPRFPWPRSFSPYTSVPNLQYLPPAGGYTSYASFCGYRPPTTTGGTDSTEVCWAPFTRTTQWGTNLTIDWTLSDSLSVKSITAYRRFDSRWVEDNDVSPATIGLGNEYQSNHSFSEELRLHGVAGQAFDYTIGGYYFDQTTIGRTHQMLNYVGIPDVVFGAPFVFEFLGNDPIPASSYAGFADGAWHITNALNLNAGVRYTHEKKDYTYSRLNIDGTPNILIGGLTGVTGHYDGSKTDYRVNLDYRWNEALMTYANVSTGFKGGGTNPRPFNVAQVQHFNPETLTNYELGVKSDFLDKRVRLNVAAFFDKYKDIQITLLSCPQFGGPGPCALPQNAGDADVKGVEAELTAQPVAGLTIEGAYSHMTFKYTSVNAATGVPLGANAPGMIETKWSAAIQYEWRLAGGSSITPRYDHTYQSGFNTNAIPSAGNYVSGYHLDNAMITWRSPDDEWQASLIGSNLSDKYYDYSVFDLTGLGGGSNYGFVAPPREYSIQVQKKF